MNITDTVDQNLFLQSEVELQKKYPVKNKFKTNLVSASEFRQVVDEVFEYISSVLKRSLGPYGSSTIIERTGSIYITKDGYNILKEIQFDDRLRWVIKSMLFNISAQVVFNVGDGTTSSIVSASHLFKLLRNLMEKHNSGSDKLRSQDVLNTMNSITNDIIDIIINNASQIDKTDTNFNEIYNIANISTNGDATVARMIQDIYKQTRNPSIEYIMTNSEQTTYEVISGYKLIDANYINNVYINDPEHNRCVIQDAHIMLFDGNVSMDYCADLIMDARDTAYRNGKRLVVVAPYYDKLILSNLYELHSKEVTAGVPSSIVVCEVSLFDSHRKRMYSDLSTLLGCRVLTEEVIRTHHKTTMELHQIKMRMVQIENDDELKGEYELLKNELTRINDTMPEFELDDYVGKCGDVTITDKEMLFSDFTNKNEVMFEASVNDANALLQKYAKSVNKNLTLMNEVYTATQRVSKLSCSVGTIYIGGNSDLEREAKKDLIEDAIKACESAYYNGYNTGGNIAIITAALKYKEMLVSTNEMTDFKNAIIDAIIIAFKNTLTDMVENKYKDMREELDADSVYECDYVVNNMVKNGICTSLTDPDLVVINSCRTDVEILKATMSIIAMLITSNQYITIKPND